MPDFKSFLKKNNLTQKDAAKYFDVTQPFISQIANGIRPIPDDFINKIKVDANLKGLHFIFDDENISDNKSFDISNEYNVKLKTYEAHIPVRVVTSTARAGFAGAYYADEYLEDMPVVMMEADREYSGKYLAFEVDGDSMEPKYVKGDVVICREIPRANWRYKLHYKDWDFVIAHGTDGIMLKEITDHNEETGEIVCHSLNGIGHPDFTLNLREVAYLYNVVQTRKSGRKR